MPNRKARSETGLLNTLQEEVTLLAEREAFVIKNYIDVYDPRNADKEQPTPTGGIKGAPVHTVLRDELYKNRSSRKIDSRRLFSR